MARMSKKEKEEKRLELNDKIRYLSEFYNESSMKITKKNLTIMIRETEQELSKLK